VVILMLVTAVTSVVVRNLLWAVGSFATSMALLALLYLTIAPFLVFAVQLVIYTTVSTGLLLGLLRQTSGLEHPPISSFARQWMAGGAVTAALGALLVLVIALAPATPWPAEPFRAGIISQPFSIRATLLDTYLVGLATLVVLIASAALGSVLLLAKPRSVQHRRKEPPADRGRRRSGP
jgi:NADH:ubiquinone oxidoreductase subunit 6 (subunit J)